MANQLQLKRATNGTDLPMSNVTTALVGEPYFNTLTAVPGTAGDGDGNLYVADSASTFVHIGGSTYTARVDEFLTAFTAETVDGNADGANANIAITSQDITGSAVNLTVPSDLAASYTLTLPPNDGDASQVLQTNGSGVLTWVDQTSGFSGFDIAADTGTAETVGNAQTVTIAGGLNVSTTVAPTDTITVALDQVLVDSNAASVLDVTGGTASAVNYIDINNAATGSGPEIAAVGADANINLELLAKGTGVVTAGGIEVVTTTGSQTLTNKTLTSPVLNTGVSGSAFLDDDTFASATASTLASSESIKAYVDGEVAGIDLTFDTAADTGTGSVATSGTLTVSGTANEIETEASGASITIGLPDNVTVTGDLAVNGADITTTATGTATLFNTNATTLNIGGAATTLSIGASNGTTTINGNLTVSGTTTTVNSTVVDIADLNITLASGAADAAAADGAGLTIDGANATWTFENNFVFTGTEAAWRSSEHMVLADDKDFFMANGTIQVLEDTGSTTQVALRNTVIDGGTY